MGRALGVSLSSSLPPCGFSSPGTAWSGQEPLVAEALGLGARVSRSHGTAGARWQRTRGFGNHPEREPG